VRAMYQSLLTTLFIIIPASMGLAQNVDVTLTAQSEAYFTINDQNSAIINIKLAKKTILTRQKDGEEWQSLFKFEDDASSHAPSDRPVHLSFADYNFDGLTDLSISSKSDSESSDHISTFFLRQKNQGFKKPLIFRNMERIAEKKQLISKIFLDGIWQHRLYQAASGKLSLLYHARFFEHYQKVDFFGADQTIIASHILPLDEKNPTQNSTPLQLPIISKRAYFHDEPFETMRRNAYVVSNDNVNVLDISQDTFWAKIRYRSDQGVETTGWIKSSNLDFTSQASKSSKSKPSNMVQTKHPKQN
jgi:hypothetical protein